MPHGNRGDVRFLTRRPGGIRVAPRPRQRARLLGDGGNRETGAGGLQVVAARPLPRRSPGDPGSLARRTRLLPPRPHPALPLAQRQPVRHLCGPQALLL